jgi:hypothetical protein
MPVPTPANGGRSGVAKIETPGDPAPEPRIWSLDDVGKALFGLQRVEPLIRELLLDPKNRFQVRENSHQLLRLDTDTGAPATNVQGMKIDVRTLFGGVPGSSLRVIGVGGATTTLEININGEGWMPVAAGTSFTQETLNELLIRVGTPGAGIALIRLGARIDPPF